MRPLIAVPTSAAIGAAVPRHVQPRAERDQLRVDRDHSLAHRDAERRPRGGGTRPRPWSRYGVLELSARAAALPATRAPTRTAAKTGTHVVLPEHEGRR